MLRLEVTGGLKSDVGRFAMDILKKENSILVTVQELWQMDLFMVSFLIFFFSVLVPVLKGLMLSFALLVAHHRDTARKVIRFLGLIGKWSMADVFVVAIFLVWMSNQGQPAVSSQNFQVLGFSLSLQTRISMVTMLGEGFWYFLAYCLLSLLGIQMADFTDSGTSATGKGVC